jgi:hypothetical protein
MASVMPDGGAGVKSLFREQTLNTRQRRQTTAHANDATAQIGGDSSRAEILSQRGRGGGRVECHAQKMPNDGGADALTVEREAGIVCVVSHSPNSAPSLARRIYGPRSVAASVSPSSP